jgi:hypothetical protein
VRDHRIRLWRHQLIGNVAENLYGYALDHGYRLLLFVAFVYGPSRLRPQSHRYARELSVFRGAESSFEFVYLFVASCRLGARLL